MKGAAEATSGVADPPRAPDGADPLALAIGEFHRAQGQLEAAAAAASPDPLVYYRVRDVALATMDLCRQLLLSAGVRVGHASGDVRAAMAALVGDDAEVLGALDALSSLANAHVVGFLRHPSDVPIQVGRRAGVVVASFVDLLSGDGYLPGS